MKSLLCLTTLLAAVCLSSAAKPEYVAKVIGSLKHCTDKSNPKVELKDVVDIIKDNQLPKNHEQECVIGCFMDQMGYVTDKKVDWAKVKELNPEKYDTPEMVAKADQVADACAKKVTQEGDECSLGVPALKCLYEEAAKHNLPKPEIKIPE